MDNRPEIPLYCFFQGSYHPAYEKEIRMAKKKCYDYNRLSPDDTEAQRKILTELIGNTGDGVIVTPPFWCDYGYRITVGNNFFSNHNLVIQDGGGVRFGDSVFIGPNCVFTTAEHAIDPEMRKAGIEIAKPITVGNNVWIGAGAIILAGVKIGDNTVIGAGSVVTESIPESVVAVGVPCRVLRKISEKDKTAYPVYDESL